MSSLKNSLFDYLYLKNEKKILWIVALCLVLSSYLGFVTPRIIKSLYESYSGGDIDQAIKMLCLVFIGEYISHTLYQVSINKYIEKLVVYIRSKSYKNWLYALENDGSGKGEGKYPMGEVLSRILTDTEAIIEMVSSGSFKIVIDFVFIISCFIGFITLNTTSGIAVMIAETLLCILLLWGSKKMATVYMAVRKSTGIMSRVIANLSGGFRFSYFHPNNSYATKKGFASFEDFLQKQLKANVWDASYFSIAESLFPILLALLVVIFPYSNISEMAVLAAIIDLLQRSIAPIKEVAGKVSSIQRARTGIIRVEEFNSDITSLPGTNSQEVFKKIQLKKLSFSLSHFQYPKRDNSHAFEIKDIKFEAMPGELIGIVGQSGCGKSTLLKMLATDIVDPKVKIKLDCLTGKEIFLAGAESRDLLDYRRQVSIVSQDSHVFSTTLKENITMGSSDEGFDAFWDDVQNKISYLAKWGISKDSFIKPKELSMGQKQLISALRSCFLTKPIVLFDEISSGFDSELELALRELVLLIQKKSLTFIVAHRIETIIESSKILVMKEGELAGAGTHKSLLDNSAVYQDFISQLNKTY